MIRVRVGIAWLLLAMLIASSQAQRSRDPLTPGEIDQLRDQAQEPDLRLKLYVQFARRRLDALDKLRADPKATDRGRQTHDALQEFLDVYDELDDNIDTFEDRRADFRGALKVIINSDVEFQAKLRALQDSPNENREEVRQYQFLLQSALDTVDSSAKDHTELLAEQEEAAKHKKKPTH